MFSASSPLAATIIAGLDASPWLAAGMVIVPAWGVSVFLTDKYRHKYPQRYDTYLAASHAKAALISAAVVGSAQLLVGDNGAPAGILWMSWALSAAADWLLALPRRRLTDRGSAGRSAEPVQAPAATAPASGPELSPVKSSAARGLGALAGEPLTGFVVKNLPPSEGGSESAVVLDDIEVTAPGTPPVGLLALRARLNSVRRLNLFLEHCAARLQYGGYLAARYEPLEDVLERMRNKWPGPLFWGAYAAHFVWYRAIPKLPWLDRLYFSPAFAWMDALAHRAGKQRNRALSKAEVWGRLAYWGLEVIAEEHQNGETLLLARRVTAPVANRRPSYYAVVALVKVGLDGELIRLHKVRSMYPFSEFLQKRIFETHGLTSTGKFRNDFRLTEYGKLIRRHWIDELPGIYDWLRGDIKLVGMRATSPQFLSMYPQELRDLYVQIKPGLVPPIFDEKTAGFEQIVETEMAYLTRYLRAPIRTDVAYFWYTFRDIFIRKVRSN